MGSTMPCRTWVRYPLAIAAMVVLAALTGCGGGSSGSSASSAAGASTSATTGTGSATSAGAADPPTAAFALTGTPATAVAVGSVYTFQPALTSSAGATIGYSIQNLPDWASFSTVTGQLLGTPTAANVGIYPNIIITASNGSSSASLSAFAVTVKSTVAANAAGTATLAWVAPTTNSDDTPLDDLTGFRIYYGTSSSSLTNVIDIVADGNTAGFIVSGLAKGTYYFKVSALDSAGVESAQSNEVTKGVT